MPPRTQLWGNPPDIPNLAAHSNGLKGGRPRKVVPRPNPEPARREKPHNGMVRRRSLEVVEFEEGGSHETTRDRY